jgi:hypothetical protein
MFTLYFQRLGAFALAQVFHPEGARRLAAAQALIPNVMLEALPPRAFRWSSPAEAAAAYHPVPEVIQALGRAAPHGLIYEAWEYEMVKRFRRLSADWPCLLREALYTAYGIPEPVDLAVYAAEAAEAIADARQALYGHL